MAALLAGIDAEHPLTGVMHAAGVLDDGVITSLTPERLARVWCGRRPTARGTCTRATAHLPLARS